MKSERSKDSRWPKRRLRFLAQLNPTRSEVRDLPPETEVSFVPMETVRERGGLSASETRQLQAVYDGYTYFRDGDVIVAKITPCFENAKGALAEDLSNNIAFGTTELHVLRPGPDLDPKLLFYITQSNHFREAGTAAMTGAAGQKRVPEDFVRDYRISLPPRSTQHAIADFLDEKTTAIDTLITKKERLIELIEEKRQATITRAVTQGLDPNVPMKDSGVEWIGEVPEHWDIRRTKYLVSKVGSGKTPRGGNQVYSDVGVLFLRSQNIHDDGLKLDDAVYISHEIDSEMAGTRVKPWDLLLNITGASLGRSCIYPNGSPPANVNQHVCIIRPKQDEVEPRFLAYAYRSSLVQNQLHALENGSSREGINFEQVGTLTVLLPQCVNDQRQVADFLDHTTTELDTVHRMIFDQIRVLREYRQTLISAAVTGQLDVHSRTTHALEPESDLETPAAAAEEVLT